MNKIFRPWLVEQPWLLPRSVPEFVPAAHVAHLIRDMARHDLDFSAILDDYDEARGYLPFDPRNDGAAALRVQPMLLHHSVGHDRQMPTYGGSHNGVHPHFEYPQLAQLSQPS